MAEVDGLLLPAEQGSGSVIAWLAGLDWLPGGECFKCEAVQVLVTKYGDQTGSRGTVALYTCQSCTFRMEVRYLGILSGTHRPARRPLRASAPPQRRLVWGGVVDDQS